MRIPNVKESHRNRAAEFVHSLGDKHTLIEFMKKDNPGLHSIFKEQVIEYRKYSNSIEEVSSYMQGFYTCWLLIREAMTDEELN